MVEHNALENSIATVRAEGNGLKGNYAIPQMRSASKDKVVYNSIMEAYLLHIKGLGIYT